MVGGSERVSSLLPAFQLVQPIELVVPPEARRHGLQPGRGHGRQTSRQRTRAHRSAARPGRLRQPGRSPRRRAFCQQRAGLLQDDRLLPRHERRAKAKVGAVHQKVGERISIIAQSAEEIERPVQHGVAQVAMPAGPGAVPVHNDSIQRCSRSEGRALVPSRACDARHDLRKSSTRGRISSFDKRMCGTASRGTVRAGVPY